VVAIVAGVLLSCYISALLWRFIINGHLPSLRRRELGVGAAATCSEIFNGATTSTYLLLCLVGHLLLQSSTTNWMQHERGKDFSARHRAGAGSRHFKIAALPRSIRTSSFQLAERQSPR
jgi:hypothetical protein